MQFIHANYFESKPPTTCFFKATILIEILNIFFLCYKKREISLLKLMHQNVWEMFTLGRPEQIFILHNFNTTLTGSQQLSTYAF